MNYLLISVKPKYAKQFLLGSKTIELRKVQPSLNVDDIVFIYFSSPEKKLKAYGFVDKIIKDTPENIWNGHAQSLGISKEDFDSYYEGKDIAYGICLKDISEFGKPINLTNLRNEFEISNPPQSYKYLSDSHLKLMERYLIPLQLYFQFYKRDLFSYGINKIWQKS